MKASTRNDVLSNRGTDHAKGASAPRTTLRNSFHKRRASDQRHFHSLPVSKRGTLDSGFHKGQPLNAVFHGRKSAIDLVWRFAPHPRDDCPRKVGVKVSKRFKKPFGVANLRARHPPQRIDHQRIFATRHNLLKPIPFAMHQAVWLLLMPFETSGLAKNSET